MKINWFCVVAILLIVCVAKIESKRGFSIARSRIVASKPNVRRNNQQRLPEHTPTNPKPVGLNVDSSKPVQPPVGPPPAYPGLGHNSVPSNGAPPAYSSNNFGNPPSYSVASGNSYSNIGKIPPRGVSSQMGSYPDATSFHGIGYGHHAYGGPSHTSGLYANNGMGMGGYSGLGTYGAGYGHGSSSFSFGNILTGLALWNVARGFNSYNRPQHIHIHHNQNENVLNNEQSTSAPGETVSPLAECTTCSETAGTSSESPVDEQSNFVTDHPSLLTYASHIGYQPNSVHYFVENKVESTTDIDDVEKSTTNFDQEETEFSTEYDTSMEAEN